jgi:hypothetical protein
LGTGFVGREKRRAPLSSNEKKVSSDAGSALAGYA